MKKVSLVVASLLLTACASRPPVIASPSLESNSKEALIRMPELSVETTISVGESLYAEAKKITTQEYSVLLLNGAKSSLDNGYSVTVRQNQHGKLYKLKGQFAAFCDGVAARSSALDVLGGSSDACLVDLDDDGTFEKSMFASYDRYFPVTPAVKYEKEALEPKLALQEEKFKREAVFQGVSNNEVKIMYREFYDNRIRGDFTQHITYELDGNGATTIVFKGFKAEVVKATGGTLTYKVISPFNS